MSKRPITFNRPEDPSFLKEIKASIGYRDGPTVDTKRQKLEDYDSADEEAAEQELDYKPQVVVVRAGDLTEEEAEREKQRLLREELEKPADLSQRVVFKKPKKAVKEEDQAEEAAGVSKEQTAADKKKKDRKEQGLSSGKSKQASNKSTGKLSFAQDEEEEDF